MRYNKNMSKITKINCLSLFPTIPLIIAKLLWLKVILAGYTIYMTRKVGKNIGSVTTTHMTMTRAPQQCYLESSPNSIVITVFNQSSAAAALPGLSSPGQCSSTAPQATFVCDTKAHSHPRK